MVSYVLAHLRKMLFQKKKKEVPFSSFFYLKKSYEIKKTWTQYFLNYMKYKMHSHFFKEFEIKSSKSIKSRSKHHSNSMAELALR